MNLIIRTPKCPICGDRHRARINREWWMRLVPKSRRYECDSCGALYLCIFGSLSIRQG
jgi:transposase-like protein